MEERLVAGIMLPLMPTTRPNIVLAEIKITVSFIAVCTEKSPVSCLYLCIRHRQGSLSPPTQDPIPFSESVRDKIFRHHNRYKHEIYESPVQTAMKDTVRLDSGVCGFDIIS